MISSYITTIPIVVVQLVLGSGDFRLCICNIFVDLNDFVSILVKIAVHINSFFYLEAVMSTARSRMHTNGILIGVFQKDMKDWRHSGEGCDLAGFGTNFWTGRLPIHSFTFDVAVLVVLIN